MVILVTSQRNSRGPAHQRRTMMNRFSETVWTVDYPLSVAGVRIGARAIIVQLPSDRLLVISPVPFDDDTAKQIDQLGVVDSIIAPNLQHHFYFDDACRRWPDARALVPPGFKDKTACVDRAVELGHQGSFEDAVHWKRLDGIPAMNEHVFVDPRTGVLILTDLAFHFREHPHWWTRLFLRLNGAYNRFGPSRLMRFLIRDNKALGQSLTELLSYEWNSIVVPHGDPIDEGGREMFTQAFEKYLPDEADAYLPAGDQ